MDVPQAPLWEVVEGAQGVAPKPSSQTDTTIENKGGAATPPHHEQRLRQLFASVCILMSSLSSTYLLVAKRPLTLL